MMEDPGSAVGEHSECEITASMALRVRRCERITDIGQRHGYRDTAWAAE